jgi:hypothetical protein
MSNRQFVVLLGVILVWLAWAAGWVVLAAVAAGLIGLAIVRLLEGDLDLAEIGARMQHRASAKK